jgi:saccharopine dehydrogenase (NAD+, L-lysine-forming)
MKIMLLGIGGVGTVVAKHIAGHKAVTALTLADMDTARAEALAKALPGKPAVDRVDAADDAALARSIKGHDLVLCAILPRFNKAVMAACLAQKIHYIDLASDASFDEMSVDPDWKRAGLLAVSGMGEDPGISNVFARYAADRLDEVDEIKVRDGEYSTSEHFPFACLFSTETFIEEAVSPARYFANGKYSAYPAFSNREVYPFPDPIGPLPIYNMSHEEVETLPKYIGKGVKRCDFKLAVPDDARQYLEMLHAIGMTRLDKVKVRGGEVTPMSVLAAVLPQPAEIGGKIKGAASILVEVEGRKAGRRMHHTLWTGLTHDDANRRQGVTATAFLTGTGAAAGVLAVATGKIKTRGVVPPESLEPEPILGILTELGLTIHKDEKAIG